MTDKEREELLEEGTEAAAEVESDVVEEVVEAESEVEGAEGEPTPEGEPEEGVEAEDAVDTVDATDDTAGGVAEEEVAEPEKMLTQSQVNEIVGRARQEGRESAMRELYERYGVSDDKELSDIFGLGQAYQGLNDEFTAQGESYKNTLAENALLKSRADESRWEDIKLILGGKGLDITMENIESLIPSHPEWRTTGVEASVGEGMMPGEPTMVDREMADGIKSEVSHSEPEKRATVRRLGGEATPMNEGAGLAENEEEKLKRLFGLS